MAYKWLFYGIQTLFVWHTMGDFCMRVVVRVGVRMPYKGGLYAIQGGLRQPPSIPSLGLPKAQRFGTLARSCQREGWKNCSEDICTVRPLDVTLWHAKSQNTAKNSRWQNINNVNTCFGLHLCLVCWHTVPGSKIFWLIWNQDLKAKKNIDC